MLVLVGARAAAPFALNPHFSFLQNISNVEMTPLEKRGKKARGLPYKVCSRVFLPRFCKVTKSSVFDFVLPHLFFKRKKTISMSRRPSATTARAQAKAIKKAQNELYSMLVRRKVHADEAVDARIAEWEKLREDFGFHKDSYAGVTTKHMEWAETGYIKGFARATKLADEFIQKYVMAAYEAMHNELRSYSGIPASQKREVAAPTGGQHGADAPDESVSGAESSGVQGMDVEPDPVVNRFERVDELGPDGLYRSVTRPVAIPPPAGILETMNKEVKQMTPSWKAKPPFAPVEKEEIPKELQDIVFSPGAIRQAKVLDTHQFELCHGGEEGELPHVHIDKSTIVKYMNYDLEEFEQADVIAVMCSVDCADKIAADVSEFYSLDPRIACHERFARMVNDKPMEYLFLDPKRTSKKQLRDCHIEHGFDLYAVQVESIDALSVELKMKIVHAALQIWRYIDNLCNKCV
jgi:hypothetical protein